MTSVHSKIESGGLAEDLDILPSPRSRRVGMAFAPGDFQVPPSLDSASDCPPIPARSPLRPTARSVPTFHQASPPDSPKLEPSKTDESEIIMPLFRRSSYQSLSGYLDVLSPHIQEVDAPPRSPSFDVDGKPLPVLPDSPLLPLSPVDVEESTSSSSSLAVPPTNPVSKRHHALLELLTSERAYASDLALIRDIHIPLALGQPAPFNAAPITPPPTNSSNSSSRTLSTSSDSSSSSHLGPPMTREDTKLIFGNISELALFADMFTERLEDALGAVLEGGVGEDKVGQLFLEIIPLLEPLYTAYITRHPSALAHLHGLPQTSALAAYLAHTRTLASSLTHAWDLPSLLIKPVQRLLKYSLLLAAIIDETPDTHPDKANLKKARESMVVVARSVNEERRRWEVVKEVLEGTKKIGEVSPGEGGKKNKKGLSVGVAASVNIGRMKSLRLVRPKEGNEEMVQVDKMEKELKKCEHFIRKLARQAVEWVASVRQLIGQLRSWAITFGRVIGLSQDSQSEAFDAFLVVVERHLLPLCTDLDTVIKQKFLHELAKLAESMASPLRLLEAMNNFEPLHYTLLNTTYTPKTRPPPALLDASQSYLALRGQLHSELPTYLVLLHKGLTAAILHFSFIQTRWYEDVRDRWGELWDALRVEGEMNAGAEETMKVWWGRWAEVDKMGANLCIVHQSNLKTFTERDRRQAERERSVSQADKFGVTPGVTAMLSSLEPLHTPRNRGMSTASKAEPSSARKGDSRRHSNESLKSGRSQKSSPSDKKRSTVRSEALDDFMQTPIMPSRTKSMPMTFQASSSSSSSSTYTASSYVKVRASDSGIRASPNAQQEFGEEVRERGRSGRKPSFRRKFTESLRPTSSHRRRSSSLKSFGPVFANATAYDRESYATSSSSSSELRAWIHAETMYACTAVHPLDPPENVEYRGIPFCTLKIGNVYDVLHEAGHPSTHEELPLRIDDGEDCLLLVKDATGDVGWALASFLVPLD